MVLKQFCGCLRQAPHVKYPHTNNMRSLLKTSAKNNKKCQLKNQEMTVFTQIISIRSVSLQ